ncbi:MAG: methionyl-tRNA formyltransferase [Candidatus Paceibacterota bacterium]
MENKNEKNSIRIAFFGSSEFSVIILDELFKENFVPSVIITAQDKPQGRGLKLTPSPVKVWAMGKNIPTLEPKKLDQNFIDELKKFNCSLFIVASFGKIIPKTVIDMPEYNILNVHPSLLPKFRGASPLESVILSDETETGVTIMLVDEEMDHGPIVAQKKSEISNWPPKISCLEKKLAEDGGKLLVEVLPKWIDRSIEPKNQIHELATYTKKIKKEDGLISLSDNPYINFKKIMALEGWPGTYFITKKKDKDIRVQIKEAEFKNNSLIIKRVTPEGKKEMNYEDFLRGL